MNLGVLDVSSGRAEAGVSHLLLQLSVGHSAEVVGCMGISKRMKAVGVAGWRMLVVFTAYQVNARCNLNSALGRGQGSWWHDSRGTLLARQVFAP